MKHWLFFITALLLLCFSACQSGRVLPPSTNQAWQAADVRLLRLPPPDDAADWMAVYARLNGVDLEIRLDDLSDILPIDTVQLALDFDTFETNSNDTLNHLFPFDNVDLLITIPARGMPQLAGPAARPGLRARYLRDPLQDSLTIRLSRQYLPDQPLASVLAARRIPAGSAQSSETLGPLRLDSTPPARAPLLLTFWDTLPSATPAQALRRWNGAHTGPYGQRHGLAILLDAAYQYQIPLAALDLVQPQQIAALEALNGLDDIRAYQEAGFLILPNVAYGDPALAETALALAGRSASGAGLSLDPFLYGDLPVDKAVAIVQSSGFAMNTAVFGYAQDNTHITNWNGMKLIPLPEEPDEVATQEGLSAQARRALLQRALSPDPSDLLVLGGALPRSPWGDLLNGAPALAYIAGHPWIQPLGGDDLQTWITQPGEPQCSELRCSGSATANEDTLEQFLPQLSPAVLREALDSAPENLFTHLALETYLALTNPTANPSLAALRGAYLGDVAYLLRAAQWAASPGDLQDCSADLDGDGVSECLLASRRVFLILSPNGGRLVFAAALNGSQPYQIIGPRSQLAVGLGEMLEWRAGEGFTSDPQEIPGAFADEAYPWQEYQLERSTGQIFFRLADGSRTKSFEILPNGFRVSITSTTPVHTQLPFIMLDAPLGMPQPHNWWSLSTTPTWIERYQVVSSPDPTRWGWGLDRRERIWLQAEGVNLQPTTFIESRALIHNLEDPNTGYPPGHYLPVPLAVVNLDSTGSFQLVVQLD